MKINLNEKCFVRNYPYLGSNWPIKEIKVVEKDFFGLKYTFYIDFHNTFFDYHKIFHLLSYHEFIRSGGQDVSGYLKYLLRDIKVNLNFPDAYAKYKEHFDDAIDWIVQNENISF